MKQLLAWLWLLGTVARAVPLMTAVFASLLMTVSLVPVAEMRILQGLIDSLVAGGDARPWLIALIVAALVGEVGRRSLDFTRTRLQSVAEILLSSRLLSCAGAEPLAMFETPAYSDQVERARRGFRQDLGASLDLTTAAVRRVAQIVGLLAALFRLNWPATLLFIGVGLPVWLVNLSVSRRHVFLHRAQTERERAASYLAGVVTDSRLAPEVRLYSLAAGLLRRWRGITSGIVREQLRYGLIRLTSQTVTYCIGVVAYVGAALLLGRSTLLGALTIGQFVAAIRAAQAVQSETISALFNISFLTFTSEFALAYRQTVAGRPTRPTRAESGRALDFGPLPVTVSGVTFRYPGVSAPALTDVSFVVKPGELIALVGENGAGKSTLVKLLLGLYEPTAGVVTVGGLAPGTHAGIAVQARMAPVFQDFQRYALTVGENVGVGDIAGIADQARIVAAAEGAGAAPFVAALPNGYDTLLGREFEGGHELSGGQWQRLAVARGYMRDAGLLVLDEPTAALDPLTEVEVFSRFRELAAGRTAFLVSHRLGAARYADRIFVFKGGQVVEMGRHDELVARNGEYAAMFAAQAQWYR